MSGQTEFDFVSAIYDQHGSAYSKLRFAGKSLFNDYIEAPVVRDLLVSGNNIRNINVLDIGCGPGIYSRLLLAAGARLTAIDSSQVMLKVAKDYCSNLASDIFTSSTFIHSSFEKARFDQEKFDLILATFMLSYFSDLSFALSKMRASLALGGKIIASMLHPIRMFSSKASGQGYIISDYFSGGLYESDFLHDNSPIPLKRYNFEQLQLAIDQAGLKIISLLEPTAAPNCGFYDSKEVDFYSKHPSILILQLNRK